MGTLTAEYASAANKDVGYSDTGSLCHMSGLDWTGVDPTGPDERTIERTAERTYDRTNVRPKEHTAERAAASGVA